MLLLPPRYRPRFSPASIWKVMSSLAQPNQPGFTSPPMWPPYPEIVLSTNNPSLNCSIGRYTRLKSIWPQGRGMYQAAVKSGIADLVGLTAGRLPATAQVTVSAAVPAPVTVQPSAGFAVVATAAVSVATCPCPAVHESVSAPSAENDRQPSRP